MKEIAFQSGKALRDAMLRGDITPTQVVETTLQKISQDNKALNAFLGVDAQGSLKRAKQLEEKLKRKEKTGPLFGIPIALKDNIAKQDWEINAGSKILKGFISPYDATVTKKILEADGILIGRTNCDEFAMGSSCENSAFGPTHNPWDTTRVPGGSSGGSAAAVAAGLVPMALGSDTGGSIRQPAALSGIVGLKPTYGSVSRYGLIAFASSLDQIGPMTRTVEDAALLFETICGYDPSDSTSAANQPKMGLESLPKGLKLGIPKEFFTPSLDPEIRKSVEAAIEVFVSQFGAKTVPVSLPHTPYAIPTYYLVATAEASSNLARYDGAKYGAREKASSLNAMYGETRNQHFGPEVKRRILLGTYVLSAGYYDAYYKKALQIRTLLKRDFEKAFSECDFIVGPTSPFPAFKIGDKSEDPLAMYLCDVFTTTANLAGLPGISIPCGLTKSNLPIGLQILGKPFSEGKLLGAALAFEQKTKFYEKRPPALGKGGA